MQETALLDTPEQVLLWESNLLKTRNLLSFHAEKVMVWRWRLFWTTKWKVTYTTEPKHMPTVDLVFGPTEEQPDLLS